jgi:hypothetical protein
VAVVEIVPLALEVRTLAKGCVVATILIPVVIGDSKQAVFVDFRIIRLVDTYRVKSRSSTGKQTMSLILRPPKRPRVCEKRFKWTMRISGHE